MQLYDKSNERGINYTTLARSAGQAYELANQRLKLGVSTGRDRPWHGERSLDAGRTGISAAIRKARHGILRKSSYWTPDPDAETNLAVRIGIKNRPAQRLIHQG